MGIATVGMTNNRLGFVFAERVTDVAGTVPKVLTTQALAIWYLRLVHGAQTPCGVCLRTGQIIERMHTSSIQAQINFTPGSRLPLRTVVREFVKGGGCVDEKRGVCAVWRGGYGNQKKGARRI